MDVSKKRRQTDWKILDLLHKLEEPVLEKQLTAKGCKNLMEELAHCRKLRRTLKVSDKLIYEFQQRYARLNNHNNRSLLISDIKKEKNSLTQPYKNRVYNEEQLQKLFDIKKESSKKEDKDIND